MKSTNYKDPHYAFSVVSFLSFPRGPSILLNTLFLTCLSIYTLIGIRDQVSHTHRKHQVVLKF
jgi:hypothetical protein